MNVPLNAASCNLTLLNFSLAIACSVRCLCLFVLFVGGLFVAFVITMKPLLSALIIYYIFPILCDAYKYKTFYYKQKVDHFSYSNNDYFQQRYLINLDHYELNGNGTMFVYAGNEGDIEMFAKNTGFMWENAEMFNAGVVFIEHRYYGRSLPYGDLSYKNKTYLGYLTSEQALADYATIITFLKENIPAGQFVPFIVFGGSYGGMLAAWLRIKYPHIVHGAISSSAPVLQFGYLTPCEKFSEIVTQDFEKEGSECPASIRKSWKIIRQMYNKTGGMKFLKQNFHLCEEFDYFNVSDLIDWLSDTWSFLAMTDYPYPTSFLVPLPAYPIKETCRYLQNSSVPDEEVLFNIYQAVSVFHNHTGKVKCFNLTESGGKSLGEAGWNYQACTEMVFPMCQTGISDMFEPLKWDFFKYEKRCFEKYGVRPGENKAIIMYGGKAITSSSNIVFTNGLLDPWSAGGILKSLSDSIIAIVIKDAAHHLDLRSSNPSDPPSVINARQLLKSWIWKFIKEAH